MTPKIPRVIMLPVSVWTGWERILEYLGPAQLTQTLEARWPARNHH